MSDEEKAQPTEDTSLLESKEETKVEVWDQTWWRIVHALSFCLGGGTFFFSTLLYFVDMKEVEDSNDDALFVLDSVSAWLYVIGSAGFLTVDVLEFFTFVDDVPLRINIFLSVIGSTFYIIGSAGYIPAIYDWTPLIGILGFILGSAFIAGSQNWKLYRIFSTPLDSNNERARYEQLNAACVEGGAMLGASCFLVGTSIYWVGPIESDPGCIVTCTTYNVAMTLWTFGSAFFWFGGLSLAWRHAVLKIT